MRIRVDERLCTGHARCHVEAPEVFDIDDAGFNTMVGRETECPPGLEEQARRGAAICPERAITLTD